MFKKKLIFQMKDIEKLEDNIYSKFDSVYDAFIEIGRNGIDSVKGTKIK